MKKNMKRKKNQWCKKQRLKEKQTNKKTKSTDIGK